MNPATFSPTPPVPPAVPGTARGHAVTSLFSRALLAIAILFVVVRALPIMSFLIGQDHAAYLLVGEGLLKGKQLYRDILESKPPGILIVYAGIAKVFGRAIWSVAVVDILLLFIISYLLFRFAEPHLGRAGAALAMMVHASMHGEMTYFWIAQPETFQVACFLAGYLLMTRRGRWSGLCSFAAGLLLGYGCWLKYNAVAFLPLVLFLPFLDTSGLDRDRPKISLTIPWRTWLARFGLLLAGLAAAVSIVLAWIVLKGAWPAMKEMQFEVVPRYAAMGVQRNPHYLLSIFARTNYNLGVWNLWAALVGLLVAWLRRDLRRFAPLFLAASSAYIAVIMQLRCLDYYFQTCYPFLALLWAYLAVSIYEAFLALARNFRQRGWRLAAGLVWIVFAQAVFWPLPDEFNKLTLRYEELREWRADAKSFYRDYPRQVSLERLHTEFGVIDYLQRNAKVGDGIYVWASLGRIYYLTGHQPPTRFISSLGLMALWSPPSWRGELMRGLRRSPPRFIIVGRGDQLPTLTYVNLDSEQYLKTFPQLETFITSGYSRVADFDSCVVYRRNPDAGTS